MVSAPDADNRDRAEQDRQDGGDHAARFVRTATKPTESSRCRGGRVPRRTKGVPEPWHYAAVVNFWAWQRKREALGE